MTVFCAACGKKVPKRRRDAEDENSYSVFFCSTRCNLTYANQMMKMMRETELEVEGEIQRETGTTGKESWIAEALDTLDQAAATATAGSQTPEEIAAKFLGAFGVKFATKLYGNLAETARAWAKARAEKKAAEAAARQKATQAPPSSPPPAPPRPVSEPGFTPPPGPRPGANGSANGSNSNGRHQNPGARRAVPPGWKTIPEPKDLDDLPLDEQREWLLRRFYLPSTATIEEVKVRYRQCAKRYHPDNKVSGNISMMKVVNATKTRLEEIERELQPAGGKKKRR